MAELIGGTLLGKVEMEAGFGLNMLIIMVITEICLPKEMLGVVCNQFWMKSATVPQVLVIRLSWCQDNGKGHMQKD